MDCKLGRRLLGAAFRAADGLNGQGYYGSLFWGTYELIL